MTSRSLVAPGTTRDASLERVELADALLPADGDDLVAPVERVLHHVLAELPGGPDDADPHRVRPVARRCEEPAVFSSRQASICGPHLLPVAVTSITEGREPNAQVAHGEAVQIPGAATRDLLGLGSEKPGELPLEAQPRVLLDDALADCIGYLVAA